MSTIKDVAQSIALYVEQRGASLGTMKNVQTKIDSLVYSETQKPLSNADKLNIIQEIKIALETRKNELPLANKHLLYFKNEENSSVDLIELMKSIEAKYKK